MKVIANELRQIVTDSQRLLEIDGAAASVRREGKWSKKEILGHLIDSAANNHQRFVRLQLQDELVLPGYDQPNWVRTQRYQERAWKDLVELWSAYNRHLAHIIESIAPQSLGNVWKAKDGDLDLAFLVRDYLRHLLHHMEQIEDSGSGH